MHKTNTQTGRVVYLVDGSRTPFLKMRGQPGPFSAADLAVQSGRPLIERLPIDKALFSHVVVGCVGPSEEEANIARIIALRLGLKESIPAFTVARNCASGLQAIDSAYQLIMTGKSDLVLAGGTEAMSRAPLLYNKGMVRWLAALNQAKTMPLKLKTLVKFHPKFLVPIISLLKGLTDPVVNLSMGQTAQELAFRFNISRDEMDNFAVQSHQRVLASQAQGAFDEIVPIYDFQGNVYEQDDGVRTDCTMERLAKLKPVFEKYGDITAGNSSQISDGAAWVVLASEEMVKKHNLPVLAKIVDIAWSGLDPTIMGLGPVHAMTPLLKQNHLTLNDIDHIEINEAFAAQVLACNAAWNETAYCKDKLGLDAKMGEIPMDKLNPQGGAIALGHPVGASGARLALHMAKMMEKNNTQKAMASLCIGGGQGGAILIERAGV